MSTAYLGDAFDIHGGGVDLVFPHHENEIAQAQAVGKPFARYWVHNGLLTVNGEKMSKSLGNFVTVDEALVDCHSQVDVLKVFFLSSHYRSPVDYTFQQIEAAYHRWFRLKFLIQDGQTHRKIWEQKWKSHFPNLTLPGERAQRIESISDEFATAMDEDMNTSEALACLDKLANLANAWCDSEDVFQRTTGPTYRTIDSQAVHNLSIFQASEKLRKLAGLLGLFEDELLELTLEQEVEIRERENARRRGDYQTADRIRRELLQENIELRDTPRGTLWSQKR